MNSKHPIPQHGESNAGTRTTDRRRFMTGMALGAGLAPLATLLRQTARAGAAPSAAANLCYSPTKTSLNPQDFSLAGYYDIQTFGDNTSYMRGLSHRYVNGQLRLLTLTHTGQLHEVAVPSAFGTRISSPTATWDISAVSGDFTGIWWEEAKQRLWVTASIDYGDSGTFYPTRVSTITLGSNGAVTNVKTVSLAGITSKRAFGGVQAVPTWAQAALGVGPYAVGWGGYTSLASQTSRACIGPSLICIPDIAGYANGAEVPSSAIKVLLDTTPDQRGVRLTIPLNYFDGGDANANGVRRENPQTAPTSPPYSGGGWLSPNSNGLGWFVWGDSYYNTGMWIDGPTKQGFVAIASLGKGKCWYGSSTLHFDDRQYELHVWDSSALGRGALTRPSSMAELVVPRGNNPMTWDGDVPMCNLSGATFDATASRMYAVGYPLGADWYTGRIYAYSVNA